MKKPALSLRDLWIVAAIIMIIGIANDGPSDSAKLQEDITPTIRTKVTRRQQSNSFETLALFGLDDQAKVSDRVVVDVQGEPQLASVRGR